MQAPMLTVGLIKSRCRTHKWVIQGDKEFWIFWFFFGIMIPDRVCAFFGKQVHDMLHLLLLCWRREHLALLHVSCTSLYSYSLVWLHNLLSVRKRMPTHPYVAVLECTNEPGRELEVDNGKGRDTIWLHSACDSEEDEDHALVQNSRQHPIIKLLINVIGQLTFTMNFHRPIRQTMSKAHKIVCSYWHFMDFYGSKIISTVPRSFPTPHWLFW